MDDLDLSIKVECMVGFDTRYLQVSRYFDSSIPIFCGYSILPGIELRFFGTSVLRYFSKLRTAILFLSNERNVKQ